MLRTAAHAELPSSYKCTSTSLLRGIHTDCRRCVWPFAGRRLDVYKLFSTVVIAGGSEQVSSLHASLADGNLNHTR